MEYQCHICIYTILLDQVEEMSCSCQCHIKLEALTTKIDAGLQNVITLLESLSKCASRETFSFAQISPIASLPEKANSNDELKRNMQLIMVNLVSKFGIIFFSYI